MIELTKVMSLDLMGSNIYWDTNGKPCGAAEAVYGGRLGYSTVLEYAKRGDHTVTKDIPANRIKWVD